MPHTLTMDRLTVLTEEPRTAGRRAPILFIHGYLATAAMWELFVDFFALLGHPCYAINLRGRRGSRPTDDLGGIRMAEYVDDARDLAQTLGRPIVFGHSMGGLIAQKLAEEDRVSAAVVVSPAPPRGIPLLSWRLTTHMLPYLPAIVRSKPLHPVFGDLRELVLNCVPQAQQQAVFAQFVPDSGRAARDMMLGAIAVEASRVRCPVLVVGADEDRFLPERIARKVAAKYGAAYRLVHGHGHASVHEPGWEGIAAEIATWLEQAGGRNLTTEQRGIA